MFSRGATLPCTVDQTLSLPITINAPLRVQRLDKSEEKYKQSFEAHPGCSSRFCWIRSKVPDVEKPERPLLTSLVDGSHREGQTSFLLGSTARNSEQSLKISTKRFSRVKSFMKSLNLESTQVIIKGEKDEFFKFIKSGSKTGKIIVDGHATLKSLYEEGVDLTSVKSLKNEFYLGNEDTNIYDYFAWFPNLKMLDIHISDKSSTVWTSLFTYSKKLVELKLKVLDFSYQDTVKIFNIIRWMVNLEVLSITISPPCDFDVVSSGDITPSTMLFSLQDMSRLRSLTLAGVNGLTTEEVVEFLRGKVPQGDAFVRREETMSDVTLINVNTIDVNELQRGTFLCDRIKGRIFCDQDLGAASAIMAHHLRRGSEGPIEEMFLTGVASFDQMHLVGNTPQPMFLKAIFEATKQAPEKYHLYSGWVFQLLGSDEKAGQYTEDLLAEATTHFGRLLNMRALRNRQNIMALEDLEEIVTILRILDRHLESPSDIPTYLSMLVTIMDFSSKKIDVGALFLRQAKKLHPIELADFIDDHRKILTCVAMQFLINYPARRFCTIRFLPRTVSLSAEMVDMFSLVEKYTTDDDLKTAVEALLKASDAAAVNADAAAADEYDDRWSAIDSVRRREVEAYWLAGPLLSSLRRFNHLYWRQGHCVPDRTNMWQSKVIGGHEDEQDRSYYGHTNMWR